MKIPMSVHKNALFAAGVASGVDISMQRMRNKKVNLKQTARIVSYAFISTYPQVSYFNAIDSIFYKKTFQSAINKTITNQIIFAPINVSCAIAWNLCFQAKPHLIGDKIKTSLIPSMAEGSLYWIPINILAFSSVSPSYRLAFFKLAGIPYKFLLNNRVTKD